MSWHGLRVEQVEQQVNTTIGFGLTEKEAKKRLKQFGKNELSEEKSRLRSNNLSGSFKTLWCSFYWRQRRFLPY